MAGKGRLECSSPTWLIAGLGLGLATDVGVLCDGRYRLLSVSLSVSIASDALMLRTCRLAHLLRHVHRPRQRTVRVGLIVIPGCLDVCLSAPADGGAAA